LLLLLRLLLLLSLPLPAVVYDTCPTLRELLSDAPAAVLFAANVVDKMQQLEVYVALKRQLQQLQWGEERFPMDLVPQVLVSVP
jgi:hypothetical protein